MPKNISPLKQFEEESMMMYKLKLFHSADPPPSQLLQLLLCLAKKKQNRRYGGDLNFKVEGTIKVNNFRLTQNKGLLYTSFGVQL